jgi:hypothetical protein
VDGGRRTVGIQEIAEGCPRLKVDRIPIHGLKELALRVQRDREGLRLDDWIGLDTVRFNLIEYDRGRTLGIVVRSA